MAFGKVYRSGIRLGYTKLPLEEDEVTAFLSVKAVKKNTGVRPSQMPKMVHFQLGVGMSGRSRLNVRLRFWRRRQIRQR